MQTTIITQSKAKELDVTYLATLYKDEPTAEEGVFTNGIVDVEARIKGEGIDELVKHALHIARYQDKPMRQDFCHAEHHGGAVHRCLHAIMHLIEDHAAHAGIPLRFAASKLAEGDAMVSQALRLDTNEQKTVAHIVRQMEEERGLDCSAALADMRYNYIGRLCQHTIVKPRESKEYRRSRRMMPETSSWVRFQFSVEKAYTVRYFTPRVRQ